MQEETQTVIWKEFCIF